MKFYSLNGGVSEVSAEFAILKGLASDGGLFMPSYIPKLSREFFSIKNLSIAEIGFAISKLFLEEEVEESVLEGICKESFDFPCPLVELEDGTFILELFHGPTFAFKDFGARYMSRLVSHFLCRNFRSRSDSRSLATVIVATSGDTGSAVAHGFFKIPGIRVVLLYPDGMVSDLQEKQLTTLGENVTALKVKGSFDDCQRLVKLAFVDKDICAHSHLISANSINFARLLPQSVYYIKTYMELVNRFERVNFSVPSGNFGNLTAGILAKRVGVPLGLFTASVNLNDTFVRYLFSGVFEPRPSVSTISNAMDIGNPSNFPRLLRLFNDDIVAMRTEISAFSFSDEATRSSILDVYRRTSYILDPHTAVGYLGSKARRANGANVILATAHPAKFETTVEDVIGSSVAVPNELASCRGKQQFVTYMSNDFTSLKRILMEQI